MKLLTRRHLSILLAALALLAPVAAAAQERHFPATHDLQAMLDYLVADGETPGIVMAVLEADGSTRILHAGSGGPGTPPIGPTSLFALGSITKTFTGVLLADMVARGEVALEDPVQKYMPDGITIPSRNGKPITVLHLATHTSGLPRLPTNHRPADRTNPYADYTVETMYAFLDGHELRRDPGAAGEYSNLGFGLLGHVLARAAGASYRTLVTERILEPLGMSMTGWAPEGASGAHPTKGHTNSAVVPYWLGTEAIDGAGGLRSTAEDMLRYLRAHAGPARTALERAMADARARQEILPDDDGWAVGSRGRSRT